ncbi:MAG: hypothetical protein NT067_03170 [Candidatus Diapherotrites archaeon]|nr:hypothetical protein [Candidatus Diapherotrites archaeon]
MKRLDVKKLAAIGAGAALIGMALAPMAAAALTKDQVLKGDSTPFDVVVGKNAATSDYLWAGNIAAKLAQLATDDTEVSCIVSGWKEGKGPTGTGTSEACKGVSVDLTVGGTQTYSSEKSKPYDTTNLDSLSGTAAEFLAELSQSQLGTLYKETKNWRYKSNSYNQTITEYIGIQADARMDYTHPKIDDLILQLDSAGDFNYRVHYSKGLPLDNDATDNTDFVADDTDNVIAVLFGVEYKLYDVDTTRSGGTVTSADKIKIVKASGEKTYALTETIEGLAGAGKYAGKTMSVKVEDISSTTEAEFTLLDDEGNEVDSISTSQEGIYLEQSFTDDTGAYALETSLYLKAVTFNAATGSGKVIIATGADLVTIQNAAQYPYSATDTDTSNDRWIATLKVGTSDSSPDANVITDITISNQSPKLWKASDGTALYAGSIWALTDAGKTAANEALFLEGEATTTPGYGYASVVFNGWKGDEDRTVVKIGNGAYVEYTDSGDTAHKVPFYLQQSNNATQGSFVIDKQTFYYKTVETDTNFQIDATTDLLNGIAVMGVDGNLITDEGKWTPTATLQTKNVDLNGINYTCTTYNAGPAWDFNCIADGYFRVATEQLSSAGDDVYIGYSTADTTNSTYWYVDDANNGVTAAGRATIPLTGSGTNSKVFKYAFMENTTYGDLWLLLDATTNFDLQYSKDIQLYGTDTGEDGVVNATYYLPNELDLGGGVVNNYYVATFGVKDNSTTGTWDTRVYIDTAEDKFPSYPNSNLSWYGNDVNYNDTTETWVLHPDTPDSYTAAAYTDFGSKFSTTAGYFEASMPQNQEKLDMVVKGFGAETTTTGGTSFCATGCDYPSLQSGVEQLVDTTSYVIENIACEACTCAAGGNVLATDVAVSPNVKTVKDLKKIGSQIVYTDDSAPNTGVVIVGGHLVNKLAANATFADGLTLAEKLTAAGETVVAVTEDGDWAVAGFTAGDTADAAKEFIDQLDAAFG